MLHASYIMLRLRQHVKVEDPSWEIPVGLFWRGGGSDIRSQSFD